MSRFSLTEYRITVLLVDDQPIIGEAISRMVADEQDIDFHYCPDPKQAIKMACRVSPTVILLDLVMPEIDGMTLVRYFRANKATHDTPLIVLSGKEESHVKAEAFALGANDYMVKLPDRLEVVARIRYHSRGYINLIQRNEAYNALLSANEQLEQKIAEQRRTEEILRESESKYRTVFENTGTAMVIVEENNTISLANTGFQRMSGYAGEEIEGRLSWTIFFDDEDLRRMREYHAMRLMDPKVGPHNYEARFISRSGDRKDVCLTMAMIPGTRKSVTALLDITERKRAEEALQKAMEHIDFMLDDVLDGLANVTTLKAEEKGIELIFHVAPDIPRHMVGDPLRLGQVLINLTNNAIKFTESGEIMVRAEVEETMGERVRLRFSVRDTGIGLTEDELGRLFRSFSQADGSTTRRFGGTGLGLAISKRLVEMMDGHIRVDSKPGEGSTFSFTAAFNLSQKSRGTKPLSVDLHGMRVLVVDDNATSRQIIRTILSAFSFEVETAPSGMRAIELLEQAAGEERHFELVLMDWKMPEMDGIEASRRIKANTKLSRIPAILLVTAYGKEEAMRHAGGADIDGFLKKPVSQSLLFETIQSIFGKEQTPWFRSAGKNQLDPSRLSGIRGARVLLVEDNVLNQQVASELLEAAGLVVTVAGNGRESVDAVLADSYDLVLMDIQMPEMDGMEASRIIRDHEQLNDLPIIAMTAHAMAGDREKSLDAGMNGHITKPIDPDELYATLLRWIKPGERKAPEIPLRPAGENPLNPEDLPDLPGIDVAEGLQKVAGNTRAYLRILKGFYTEYRSTVPSILADMESGRFEEALRTAHTLKGVAGNIGALDLFGAASDLELALKEGRTEDARQLRTAFKTCLLDVIEGLASLDKPGGAEAVPKALLRGVNLDAARKATAKMARLLADGNMEAENFMRELRAALAGTGLDKALNTLEEHIGMFDFESALAALDPIARVLETGE